MHNLKETENYYGKDAYSPSRIPQQPAARRRSLLKKLVGFRLAWGSTQDVITQDLMEDPTPEEMRSRALADKIRAEQKAAGTYKPLPFEDVDMHMVFDHERFRFAQLPARSQVWMILHVLFKYSLLFLVPFSIPFDILFAIDQGGWGLKEIKERSAAFLFTMILLPPWLILRLLINNFPRLWFRPPYGPLWELNRVTGLVTIFDKPVKGQRNTKAGFVAPFYEFDAYIVTIPDRQGLPMNWFFIAHRYSDARINLRPMLVPDPSIIKPSALWDFFQNYMNIEQPLPDFPLFEAYRHLDPVTAEHDKKTGRNPRYWFDMDNETFAQKVKEMQARISNLNTLERPNLMARYVSYVD